MLASAFVVACTALCPAWCDELRGVYVPSPQEYLLEMAAHAAAWHAVSPAADVEGSEQKTLVLGAVHGECDRDALCKSWDLFVASRAFLAPALAHALVLEIHERTKQLFVLGDAQCAEIAEVVDGAVRQRRECLESIRKEWTCVTAEEWESQRVRPGAFCTREFMSSRLLCGVPYKDADNDRRFYMLGPYARVHPAYLKSLSDFVSGCCKDVWRDEGVASAIAKLLCEGELTTKNIEIYGPDMSGFLTVVSQETVDRICSALTSLYVDAILREIDLPKLFATAAVDVQNPPVN